MSDPTKEAHIDKDPSTREIVDVTHGHVYLKITPPKNRYKGKCNTCGRTTDEEKEFHNTCGANGCKGTVEEHFYVDGDRLLAFINSVQHMGRMLEDVKLGDVRSVFATGLRIGAVSNIMEQEKAWVEAFDRIAKDMEAHAQTQKQFRADTIERMKFMKGALGLIADEGFARAFVHLERMAAVLDRLEHHHKTGLLAAVATIGKEPTPNAK